MVIYPDRDMEAACILLSLITDRMMVASDTFRMWGARKAEVSKLLKAGKILAIAHDGNGSPSSRPPNTAHWLFLGVCADPERGCPTFRVDGPPPDMLRALVEKSKIATPPVTLTNKDLGNGKRRL